MGGRDEVGIRSKPDDPDPLQDGFERERPDPAHDQTIELVQKHTHDDIVGKKIEGRHGRAKHCDKDSGKQIVEDVVRRQLLK